VFSGNVAPLQQTNKRGHTRVIPGFASVSSPQFRPVLDLSTYDTLEVRLRSDGRPYAFMIEPQQYGLPDMYQVRLSFP